MAEQSQAVPTTEKPHFATLLLMALAPEEVGARIRTAPDVTCSRVGLLAVAGGRSALYGCQWATATGGGITGLGVARRCLVWADGGAYDVTRQARAVFRLQGQRAPC